MAKNPHYFSQLAHVEVLTTDLAKSVEFFRDVVGMDETGRENDSVYLRAWGDYFHHTRLSLFDKSGRLLIEISISVECDYVTELKPFDVSAFISGPWIQDFLECYEKFQAKKKARDI